MPRSTKHYENIHIPLWLIKDTCWMMEWKTIGISMIVPTIAVAILIAIRTYRVKEFLINLAICFWILANAYWMCCEFLGFVEMKYIAGLPFLLGAICVVLFYWNAFKENKSLLS